MALPGIIRGLDDAGIVLAEFALRKSSLDEVFLALTGLRGRPDETEPELDASRETERTRA